MASQSAANRLQPRQSINSTARNPGQPMLGQRNTPFLDHNQQDLLLAALNSQAATGAETAASNNQSSKDLQQQTQLSTTMNGDDSSLFMSPAAAHLDGLNGDFTPDLDYLDNDFDFENADLGGEMIGALPGAEQHEKRKNPDEASDDEDEGDAKRQEGGKGAKKPGRKPLTSEPTTVYISQSY